MDKLDAMKEIIVESNELGSKIELTAKTQLKTSTNFKIWFSTHNLFCLLHIEMDSRQCGKSYAPVLNLST